MDGSDDYHAEMQSLRAELRGLRETVDGRHLSAVPADKPKRLTLSEILEAHLAALSKHGGERSMVKLTRNARGDTQLEVAVRTGDTSEIQTVEECAAEAIRVYDQLRALYPIGAKPLADADA